MVKTFFNVLSTVFLMLGAVIGAGFISGAELLNFFGTENFLSSVIIAIFLTAVVFCLVFRAFKRFEKTEDGVEKLLGGKTVYSFFTCFSSYVFTASMLAGLDELWNSLNLLNGVPVFSIITIILISIFSQYGVKGLERLNLFLMPAVLIIVNVLIFSKHNLDLTAIKKPLLTQTIKSMLYVFMNTFICMPVMRECAKNKGKKSLILSSIIVALIVGAQSLIILCAIKGSSVLNRTHMPLFDLMNKGGFSIPFFLCLLVGTLTSAFSAYYPAYAFAKNKGKKFGVIVSAVLTLTLSRLGLNLIVKYLYPLIGGLGALFVIRSLIGIKKKTNADNKRNHLFYGGYYVKKEKK